MRRHLSPLAILWAVAMLAAAGCSPQQPFYFGRPKGGDHYVGVAQQIEYPDVETVGLDEVNEAKAPLTLDNPKPDSYWDLGLEDALRISLANSTVLRSLGGVQFTPTGTVGVPSSMIQQPGLAATMYVPALAESNPIYGVEAALSQFDAQFSTSVFWENNIIPHNTAGLGAEFNPIDYKQQVGDFSAEVSKTTASGAQFDIKHDVRYNLDNIPISIKRWPDDWNVDLLAEARVPLLQGAGVGFNRIAGPAATPGQFNGVMIARLRSDQNLNDFEAAVRNLCSDVERAYWNLYYAYRLLDSRIAGRDAALETWRKINAKSMAGATGGGALELAQSHDDYLLFETQLKQAQSNVYKTENVLRYMMGLTHSDGRLIRPSDEPTKAKVDFDWYDAHAEALTRAVELRKQKFVIKERELELAAAKNFLLPRLDAVARYGWAGIGDLLMDPSRGLQPEDPTLPASPTNPLVPHSGYGSLATGDFPTWHLGLEMRVPLGFRREMAGVRFAQLSLVRERKVLDEMELELSHQLADAFRDVSENYALTQDNYNRWLAGKRETAAAQETYEAGKVTLDQVLFARRREAEAEGEYYRTLIEYNLAITNVHYRKGSLLEYDGVYLAEGPWPAKAYFDARRRARHRDASHFIDYGFTQPRIVSQGPYNQGVGQALPEGSLPIEAPLPAGKTETTSPEQVPPPAPVPMPPPATGGEKAGADSSASAGPADLGPGSRVVPVANLEHNSDSAGRGYDLAGMNLQELTGGPALGRAAQPMPGVKAAGYQEAAQVTNNAGSGGAHGSIANPSPAPSNPPAARWKNVQYRSDRSELN